MATVRGFWPDLCWESRTKWSSRMIKSLNLARKKILVKLKTIEIEQRKNWFLERSSIKNLSALEEENEKMTWKHHKNQTASTFCKITKVLKDFSLWREHMEHHIPEWQWLRKFVLWCSAIQALYPYNQDRGKSGYCCSWQQTLESSVFWF